MTKPTNTQSQKRFEESLGSLFIPATEAKECILFLKSSSDIGVIRNGGRNGARFAPQSLLSHFKKLSLTSKLKTHHFKEIEVASIHEEEADFKISQIQQSSRIQNAINQENAAFVCHIGGGHDHIYPWS